MIGLEFDCPKCGNMNEHNVRLENYGEYIDQIKHRKEIKAYKKYLQIKIKDKK